MIGVWAAGGAANRRRHKQKAPEQMAPELFAYQLFEDDYSLKEFATIVFYLAQFLQY